VVLMFQKAVYSGTESRLDTSGEEKRTQIQMNKRKRRKMPRKIGGKKQKSKLHYSMKRDECDNKALCFRELIPEKEAKGIGKSPLKKDTIEKGNQKGEGIEQAAMRNQR